MIPSKASARRPVAIDLFSGAGGLSLGFESAGFDLLSAVEYDPVHAAVHLFNFPNTDVICADVAQVTGDQLLRSARVGWERHYPGTEWDGVVDSIIGGPSCQGFSTMGKQDASDERNQLLFEFARLVVEVRPRTFCMENVPGLLDPRFDTLRSRVLNQLRGAGYLISGETEVLKAEDFGVPQKRRRVMILGIHESAVEGESQAPTPPIVTVARPFTVAEAFVRLPQIAEHDSLNQTDLFAWPAGSEHDFATEEGSYACMAGLFGDGSSDKGHPRLIDANTLSGCRRTQHAEASIKRYAATPQGAKEPVSRLRRLSLAEPSLTLRAGTGRERGAFSAARPLHPTEPRVVTVREAARLHSFPDWFRFHTTNWHAHRQIGNSVPPMLASAAAKSLLRALNLTAQKSRLPALQLGPEALLSLSPTTAAAWFTVDENQVPKRRRQPIEPAEPADHIHALQHVRTRTEHLATAGVEIWSPQDARNPKD